MPRTGQLAGPWDLALKGALPAAATSLLITGAWDPAFSLLFPHFHAFLCLLSRFHFAAFPVILLILLIFFPIYFSPFALSPLFICALSCLFALFFLFSFIFPFHSFTSGITERLFQQPSLLSLLHQKRFSFLFSF